MTVFTTSADIGPLIRSLRSARKWSAQRLADESGCSKSSVTLIESGRRIPHTPLLIAILGALGHDLAAVPKEVS